MRGEFEGRAVTIQDVFEAVGASHAGKPSLESLRRLEAVACPGPGACGGQFTANTMGMAFEMMGISPMGTNEVPAVDSRKAAGVEGGGRPGMDLLQREIRPRPIITPKTL